VEEWTVPGIGTHDSNGRHQQAIAPGGIGRQESSSPIQPDVSIGMPVPQGPSGLILLSVIHQLTREPGARVDVFNQDLILSRESRAKGGVKIVRRK
jgi:hypothetical protein